MRADFITYWTGKNSHGHKMTLVFEGRLVDVDLTEYWTARPAVMLLNTPGFQGVISVAPKWPDEWGYTASVGDVLLYGSKRYKTREEAVEALRVELAAYHAEQRRCAEDPVYALEKLLKQYDWTSHMSDDHRVWAAGERQTEKLHALREKVDPKVYAELVERYRPKGL